MNLKRILGAAALASAAALTAPVQAATITNADGSFAFTGFDWAQGGTAAITGFAPVTGNVFTLQYIGWATALNNTPTNFVPPSMDVNANGAPDLGKTYEYTAVANLTETVTGCTSVVAPSTCTFSVVAGTFSIYYHTTPNANALAGGLGTGFSDGTLIISGTFGVQPSGSFSTTDATGLNGFGVSGLLGTVTFTNGAFIAPELLGTTIVTTLQLGSFTTNWVNPGGIGGVAFAPGTIVLQADANQDFSERSVPEPGSLALLAGSLLAAGLFTRRRR